MLPSSTPLGGSIGSWLGIRAYNALGWNAVCPLVAVLAGLALTRHLPSLRSRTALSGRAASAEKLFGILMFVC
ncbi:putative MFS transporter [Frankia alni ACN14a]|uniref:MFS transporter n=1 Tax=Frankia alni (strain DSM 45986 / CECT 9034 / ACN14a) TaxID=326424 RepID=Q0RL84_FRAAA|nr:putative MFS transporter [Frankia alni ACN14a]